MDRLAIARLRLRNQHLDGAFPLASPADVVADLLAMQAQEFLVAKWSIGQRTKAADDDAVGRAFAKGTFLRTHALRPTWHFVAADDIRWLVALTAPRVKALLAYYDRKLELDAKVLARCNRILERELRDGRQRTRVELGASLRRAGIEAEGQRLAHVLMHAEQDTLVCSGALRGKQHTYALLDERAPKARTLAHDEALAELTLRFFRSRGPATVKDLAVWSSLRIQDVKRGLAMVGGQLASEVVGDRTYWFAETARPRARARATKGAGAVSILLVQGYDEYVMAYGETKDVLLPPPRRGPKDTIPFLHAVLVDGRLAGHWQRTVTKSAMAITVQPFEPFDARHTQALQDEAERYARFAGLPATLTIA